MLSISGCASGYKRFYHSVPEPALRHVSEERIHAPSGDPQVRNAHAMSRQLVLQMQEQGFAPIGYSHFNSGRHQSRSSVISEARRVGADLVVIIDPSYTGTRSGEMAVTTPTTSTSYTTGSATAYGAGGSATAYGQSTTTTYGTSTSYIPYSVDRYDFGAVFFVAVKSHFGIIMSDLSAEQARMVQSNHGVYVDGIVRDSPAFNADILQGDIILADNGVKVEGSRWLENEAKNHPGKIMHLKVWRSGSVIDKTVIID